MRQKERITNESVFKDMQNGLSAEEMASKYGMTTPKFKSIFDRGRNWNTKKAKSSSLPFVFLVLFCWACLLYFITGCSGNSYSVECNRIPKYEITWCENYIRDLRDEGKDWEYIELLIDVSCRQMDSNRYDCAMFLLNKIKEEYDG